MMHQKTYLSYLDKYQKSWRVEPMEYKKLSDFLIESNLKVDIDDKEEYKCGGVRLNGRGVFVREIKLGSDIQKQWVMHRVEKNNIVYSTLFADKGAFAIATEADEELIFSEKFVCFKIIDENVLPEYLHVIFQTDFLSAQCDAFKTGMAAFSLSHSSKKKVLKLTIPVPEKAEQLRIVEEYKAYEGLRLSLDDESETIKSAASVLTKKYVESHLNGVKTVPLSDLGQYTNRPAEVVPGEEYKQITVKLHGNGVVLRKMEDGGNIKSIQHSVVGGDLIYSKIDVKSGAIGFVPDELTGGVVTADFPTVKMKNLTQIDREFLLIYFSSDIFYESMEDKSKGTTNRVRTKKSSFLNHLVPWGDEQYRENVVKEYRALRQYVDELQSSAEKIQNDIPMMTSKYLNKLLNIGR